MTRKDEPSLREISWAEEGESGSRRAFAGRGTMLYLWETDLGIAAFRFSFPWEGMDVCVSWDRDQPGLSWDRSTTGGVRMATKLLEPLPERPKVDVVDLFERLSRRVDPRVRFLVLDRLRSEPMLPDPPAKMDEERDLP